MILTEDQIEKLSIQLQNLISDADAIHDIETRLQTISSRCNQIYHNLVELQVSSDELPEEILKLFERLRGRADSSRVFMSDFFMLRTSTVNQIDAILPRSHILTLPKSKEDELIDELAEIVKAGAIAAYVLQTNMYCLAFLFPMTAVGFFDLERTFAGYCGQPHYTPHSHEAYNADADIEIFNLYTVLITAINNYGKTKDLGKINKPAEIEDLSGFIDNCTRILEDRRYAQIASAFHEKLTELYLYLEAEQLGTAQSNQVKIV